MQTHTSSRGVCAKTSKAVHAGKQAKSPRGLDALILVLRQLKNKVLRAVGLKRPKRKTANVTQNRIKRLVERDGDKCCWCKGDMDFDTENKMAPLAVSLEHIVKISQGGGNTIDNLKLAHRACNIGREGPGFHIAKAKTFKASLKLTHAKKKQADEALKAKERLAQAGQDQP